MQKISSRSLSATWFTLPEPTPGGATFRIPQSLRVSVFVVPALVPHLPPPFLPSPYFSLSRLHGETRGFFTDHFISYARTLCILKCTRETPSELWPFARSGTRRAFSSWITLPLRPLFWLARRTRCSKFIKIKSDFKNNHIVDIDETMKIKFCIDVLILSFLAYNSNDVVQNSWEIHSRD